VDAEGENASRQAGEDSVNSKFTSNITLNENSLHSLLKCYLLHPKYEGTAKLYSVNH
jgi:hypothetical protein